METPELTLCMIVRNEEKHLDRCLQSVKSLVREIIVVDTGSSDNTRDIALRYGAAIIDFPWNEDFAEARNAGLRLATGRWILVLDADEELGDTDVASLNRLMEQPDVYGCYIQMINFVGAQPGEEYVTDSVCRLFRNDPRITYTGPIHEDIVPSIIAIPGSRIVYAPLTVRHYGYLDDVLIRKKKNERNLAILQKVVAQSPDDLRMRYALGTEYFQTGDYARALHIFQPLISQTPVFAGFTSDLVLKTVFCLRETGQVEEALSLVDEAVLFYPDFTDLWELKATLHLERGRLPESLKAVMQALRVGQNPLKYSTSSGSGTYRSHYLAGTIYERLFRMQEAISHYRKALECHPGYGPAWHRWAWISFVLGSEEELFAFLSENGDRIPQHMRNVLLEAAIDARKTETSRRLLGQPGKLAVNPILYASFLIQIKEDEQARMLLQQLTEQPEYRKESHLYLWALAMKENDLLTGMKRMEQISILDPSFSAVEALLKGDSVRSLPLSTCRQCQQALLRSGAWHALLQFLRQLRPGLAVPWLPVRAMAAFLSAPLNCRREFLELCMERRETLSFAEVVLAGVIAHSSGDLAQAVIWFQAARSTNSERLEPLVGLASSYVDAAGKRHGNIVLHLQTSPPLCLIGL